jgi:ERCC4-type nuclease
VSSEIKPLDKSEIIIVCDTREQKPYQFKDYKTERVGLKTADYSVKGLETHVAIERKELSDFVACVGRERERFEREIQRLKGFPIRYIVVEAHPIEIEQQRYRGSTHPNSIFGSIHSWLADGIPILLLGDRCRAEKTVSGILWHAAKRQFHENSGYRQMILDARNVLDVEDIATKGA